MEQIILLRLFTVATRQSEAVKCQFSQLDTGVFWHWLVCLICIFDSNSTPCCSSCVSVSDGDLVSTHTFAPKFSNFFALFSHFCVNICKNQIINKMSFGQKQLFALTGPTFSTWYIQVRGFRPRINSLLFLFVSVGSFLGPFQVQTKPIWFCYFHSIQWNSFIPLGGVEWSRDVL